MKTARNILALLVVTLLAMPVVAAERMIELRLEGADAVELHNLAGAARIVPGSGAPVIRARIRADKAEHADAVVLRRNDRGGVAEVVVEYPSGLSRIRYDGDEFQRLDASVEYQGRRIRVSNKDGDLVRVDLEILVSESGQLEFRQLIGPITAEGVNAGLTLASSYGAIRVTDGAGLLAANTASGRVEVASFRGEANANTGSGAVTLENVLGDVRARTGSGGVTMRGMDGNVVAETGSGGIRIDDAGGSLVARTGSGGVRVAGLRAGPELTVSTGSGSINVAGDLGAVEKLTLRTGSGSITAESSAPMSMRLHLSTGSGSFRVDLPNLSEIESGRRSFRAVAGEGAGEGRIATGSGSIRLSAP
jgi:DUF4097 and DUF4098 domain-containing protein YvlB